MLAFAKVQGGQKSAHFVIYHIDATVQDKVKQILPKCSGSSKRIKNRLQFLYGSLKYSL